MPLRHKDTKVHKEDKWVILIIFGFLSALVPFAKGIPLGVAKIFVTL